MSMQSHQNLHEINDDKLITVTEYCNVARLHNAWKMQVECDTTTLDTHYIF